ncbi:hypothetical protein F4860DRAFT_516333 [Xylaria cubensis]|nr:hypothetical protein F4860DRAFT_516333 [Xylaria cubensis]
MRLFIETLFSLAPLSSSSPTVYSEILRPTNSVLIPTVVSGNVDCSAASSNTVFQLTFISYGNWTALPAQEENPIQHLESISFAVSNLANGVSTVCAFSVSDTLSAKLEAGEDPTPSMNSLPFVGESFRTATAAASENGVTSNGKAAGKSGIGAAWQACADRKDTDGKHRFTIATGAMFGLSERSLSINQTWFCHDDAERLVAFTGVANTTLNLTCFDSEVSGYHLQNCTTVDLALPVQLL